MAYKPATKPDAAGTESALTSKTPAELDALIAEAQAAKAQVKETARTTLRDKLTALIAKADLGLTIREIFREELTPAPRAAAANAAAPSTYTNPDDPTQTWTSGSVGKRPKWVKALLPTT